MEKKWGNLGGFLGIEDDDGCSFFLYRIILLLLLLLLLFRIFFSDFYWPIASRHLDFQPSESVTHGS